MPPYTVIRYNGSLFFANVNFLEEQILEVVSEMPELRRILIVGNGINELDTSGEETLSHMIDSLRDAGYDISMSGLNDWVLDTMRRSGLYDKIGEDHLFRNAARAIEAIYDKAHKGSGERPCPLKKTAITGLPVSKTVKRDSAIYRTPGPTGLGNKRKNRE